jgi:spermidine synthase
VTASLLLAQALSVVVAAAMLRQSPSLIASLAGATPGFGAKILAESVTAFAVFLAPTVIMGALFSHLVGMLARHGIGRAYALNTLGSALAPFVLGLVAIPELGYTDAFFALSWAYLGLMVLFCWFRRFSTAWQLGSMVAVVAATVLGRGSLVLIEIPEDWKPLEQRESVMGVVTVSEHRTGRGPKLRRLQVDQQFRMGGALSIGERRMGHIPLLLHGEAEHVLYLGVGTGATAGAALAHPVESIDAVELVPEVLDALHYFDDVNGNLAEAERAHLHAADARRWLAASDRRWDVIVADLFHPERDGAGFLYSREHFVAVREHLAEGGLFVQWLPLHQIDPDTLRTVIATFLDVFPETHSWLALYNVDSPAFGLVGTVGEPPLRVDLDRLVATTRDDAFAPVVLQDPRDLFAGYMLDRDALAALAGDAPLNTDLRPRVLFDAPKSGRDELGLANLEILVPLRTPYPPALVHARELGEFASHTAAFAAALDHYLAGEMIYVREARPDEPLPEAAVREYVAAFEAAPEFLPTHGRLKSHVALLQRAGFEDEARALVERLGGGG